MHSHKVLVLGSTGMLGHSILGVFRELGGFRIYGTTRDLSTRPKCDTDAEIVSGVDAFDFDSVVDAVRKVQPDVVVNCIGIIKQLPAARDAIPAITINALFPHQLLSVCNSQGVRLLHVSTDCVFSGRKGRYTEDDAPDPVDLYGRTKLLGEVSDSGCLTLRTSIVGRERTTRNGLIEWFLSQTGRTVGGYTEAIYSGLTTPVLAAVMARVIEHHPELSGLWHVASEPISKYELLRLVNESFQAGVELIEDDTVTCDRSLDGARFRKATGFRAPSWQDMINQLSEGTFSDLTRWSDDVSGR